MKTSEVNTEAYVQKKFFLISQVFYPDEVSTAGLFTDLCIEMVRNRVETEVWCAQPSYSKVRKWQPKHVIHKGVSIQYLLSSNFYKGYLIGRIANILTFSTSVFFRLLFSKEKCPVFSHTTPPVLGIILSILCRIKKRRFNYILLDIYPEGIIRVGKVSRNNPVIRFWQFLFKISLVKSSKIIVLGRDMQQWLIEVCPDCKSKIRYIPHWQKAERIIPEAFSDNNLVRFYKLEDKFVVQYSGNMGLWNDMETLGRAVTMMPDVIFMFVGGGIRRKELFALFKNDQGNILDLPFQPSDKLSNVLSCCHIAVVTMREGLEGVAVPSKIYGIMASGRPVIALVPEQSEISLIVKEEKCGIVVKLGDTDGFVNAVTLLKSDLSLRISMGENAFRAFNQKYNILKISREYLGLLDA